MHIRKRSDCILAVLLFLGAVFFYYETYQIREVFSYSFGPRVFPRIPTDPLAVVRYFSLRMRRRAARVAA